MLIRHRHFADHLFVLFVFCYWDAPVGWPPWPSQDVIVDHILHLFYCLVFFFLCLVVELDDLH